MIECLALAGAFRLGQADHCRRTTGNAEGVSSTICESLRQKDLYRTQLWRESATRWITQGETCARTG